MKRAKRQPERTLAIMKVIDFLEVEAELGFPTLSLAEAERGIEVTALANVRFQRRVRISIQQGHAKSYARKQILRSQAEQQRLADAEAQDLYVGLTDSEVQEDTDERCHQYDQG